MSIIKTLKAEIKKKTSSFRSINGLVGTEAIHLKSLLLKLNVITLFRPLSEGLSGVAVKSENLKFMLVNSNHQIGKQHFTIAHELYHLFEQENFTFQKCVTGLFSGQKDIEEKRADLFAVNLLMPEDGIYDLIPESEIKSQQVSLPTVYRIQNYYSVSFAATRFRLEELGFLKQGFGEEMKGRIISESVNLGFGKNLFQPGNEGVVIGDYGVKAQSKFKGGQIGESLYFEMMNAIGVDILQTKNLVDE